MLSTRETLSVSLFKLNFYTFSIIENMLHAKYRKSLSVSFFKLNYYTFSIYKKCFMLSTVNH